MSKTHIHFLYDFEAKEFSLQFKSRNYAKAYQAQNSEARILTESPYDVWLPCAWGLVCVRSCSHGMAAMFKSRSAAEEWQRRTIIGYLVRIGEDTGVCFERDWDLVDLEKKIGILHDELLKPMPAPAKAPARRRRSVTDWIHVERQRPSKHV